MTVFARLLRLDWRASSAVGLGLALWAFAACSSDDDGSEGPAGDPADCRLIADRCHSYSASSDLANECHETGHEGASPARCTELKESCLAECSPPPDAGAGGSGGGSSGASSGGTTAGGAGNAGVSGAGGALSGGMAGQSSGGAGGSGAAGQGGTGGASPGGSGGSAGSPADGGETACEALGRICHEVGPGRPEECHEIGHDGDEALCEEELVDCLAVCQDGGA